MSLPEMRAYLRLSSDETAEDGLITRLIPAARAAVETAARRLLRPARFRVVLSDWPRLGLLPLPLSPLVAVLRAGRVDARGGVTAIEPGPIRIGPDPWEAPCLLFGPDLPPLGPASALVEVSAGCGGEGPPVPEPLIQALRLTVADWFENRGDAGRDGAPRPLPPEAAGLADTCRRMRL
ncbi:phiE125 gp8 family protein [Methylorubrum populi]|uniref:PhiE125 gp8 family protein n=1 Tax=Methylorubrum populi TaxID=223967 RepID=A0A160PCM5_9HYPH|nr:phiE125 gp8 family protein [Methylorubrum populi]